MAADKKEAIKIAINAGIDMAMEPYEWDFCTLLKELVHEGEVPISRINDATGVTYNEKGAYWAENKPKSKKP